MRDQEWERSALKKTNKSLTLAPFGTQAALESDVLVRMLMVSRFSNTHSTSDRPGHSGGNRHPYHPGAKMWSSNRLIDFEELYIFVTLRPSFALRDSMNVSIPNKSACLSVWTKHKWKWCAFKQPHFITFLSLCRHPAYISAGC